MDENKGSKIFGGGYKTNSRSSNLELLRILAMLSIVAHHSVVNSGIMDSLGFNALTSNMLFLQLWGMWGKTAINVFVLITGYFMCTSNLTWQRFAKIYLEAKFYRILFWIIFLFAGYEVISFSSIFKMAFGYLQGINGGFTSSFFAFYLLIPFMNALIEKLGKDMWRLIMLLLAMFTITSTFFFNDVIFHHVFWYVTLYFVAAYIRLYPTQWMNSSKVTGVLLGVTVILAILSVLVIDGLGFYLNIDKDWGVSYFMVADSNKLLAFVVGCSAFLFFKNLKMKNSVVINRIAATTFGVLCIHANSDAMRQWLWKDLLGIAGFYELSLLQLIIAMTLVTVGVFVVCSILDTFRIYLIEKPVLSLLNRYDEHIRKMANRMLTRIENVVNQ